MSLKGHVLTAGCQLIKVEPLDGGATRKEWALGCSPEGVLGPRLFLLVPGPASSGHQASRSDHQTPLLRNSAFSQAWQPWEGPVTLDWDL
jgi:hypothetical protein